MEKALTRAFPKIQFNAKGTFPNIVEKEMDI